MFLCAYIYYANFAFGDLLCFAAAFSSVVFYIILIYYQKDKIPFVKYLFITRGMKKKEEDISDEESLERFKDKCAGAAAYALAISVLINIAWLTVTLVKLFI